MIGVKLMYIFQILGSKVYHRRYQQVKYKINRWGYQNSDNSALIVITSNNNNNNNNNDCKKHNNVSSKSYCCKNDGDIFSSDTHS